MTEDSRIIEQGKLIDDDFLRTVLDILEKAEKSSLFNIITKAATVKRELEEVDKEYWQVVVVENKDRH